MIEFEGVALLPVDVSSAQLMISLAGPAEDPAVTGVISGGNTRDDVVLQESAQATEDEWIASLLSGASSDVIAAGIPGPGEVDLLDPQATEGDGEEEQVIVITGTRTTSGRSYTWDGNDQSETWGTGGGTGGGTGVPATPVEQHPQDCGTEDGAAVQAAKHVSGELPAGVSGPEDPVTTATGNDWKTVEFGAVIVRNSDGSYGALNDMIYSSNQATYVGLPDSSGQSVQGVWHSHPIRAGVEQQAIDRYPSPADWASLARIGGQAGAAADPSIWLMGPDGITREFKLSERSNIENLSAEQMKQGQGLPGRERTQSCG